MAEDYTYQGTPPGYGDTFFIYAFDVDSANGTGANITSGTSAYNQRIVISDGAFVLRWWRGVDQYGNACQGIQIRDRLQTPFFSDIITPNLSSGVMAPYMGTGWPVAPEVEYPDSGYIGFDIIDALPNASQPGQLAFYGVRRRSGIQNDPIPSQEPYYEKPFQYQATVTVPAGWSYNSGGYLTVIPVTDFDFELRRIDCYAGSSPDAGGGGGTQPD